MLIIESDTKSRSSASSSGDLRRKEQRAEHHDAGHGRQLFDEVFRRRVAVNAILEMGALADEKGAAPKEAVAGGGRQVGKPDREKESHAEQLGEFACVDRIGLRTRLPDELTWKTCATRTVKTRFTLRGRAKVDRQWKLFCLVHNIEKLAHHGLAA